MTEQKWQKDAADQVSLVYRSRIEKARLIAYPSLLGLPNE